MDDARALEVFMAIHSCNPREAPGSKAMTKRAFELCEGLPDAPRVLDVGCGPGTQTLDLAEICAGTFVAVDLHEPYLERLADEAERRGLGGRITARRADMAKLDFEPDSFDLIWSEGAIYSMGFESGLKSWRPLLADGGCMAVSEATWLVPDPPDEVRAFWSEGYPAMQDVASNRQTIRAAGYRMLGHFVLPASCWLDYYAQLESRMAALAPEYADDAEALGVFAAERREIELYRNYPDTYGYVFYVLRKEH